MSYQALYRKYRPTNFSEVVGQDVVTKTLQHALMSGRVSHAYLFSGPRGIGKTTLSKILAKSVNCLELENGNACGHCKNCIEASKRECPDIIEIDAASNNGVDEIRELRDKINLVPSELKYKVYIIDEVHMLSIGAFNALLKTLEEPPSHVIFILATTDLHKVPITIVSRCQCFYFKRISEHDIVSRMKEVVEKEKIQIDDDVLLAIANYSDGGMRDALGLLDKLVSYSNERITMQDMQEVNGIVSDEDIKELIQHIQKKDVSFVLEQLDEYYKNGKDLIRLVEEMILNLRNQLVSKYLDHNDTIDSAFVSQFAVKLNQILNELKNSGNLKVLLEIELLQFMDDGANQNHIEKLENQIEEKQVLSQKVEKSVNDLNVASHVEKTESIDKKEEIEQRKPDETTSNIANKMTDEEVKSRNDLRINNTFALATKADLLKIRNQWKNIMDYTLDREIGAIACFLADGVPVAASSKNVIITFEYPSMIERGNDIMESVEQAFERIFGTFYHLVFLTNEDWQKEKEQYISNKNQNISYTYQEEVEKIVLIETNETKTDPLDYLDEENNLTKTAIQLFGKDIVKID